MRVNIERLMAGRSGGTLRMVIEPLMTIPMRQRLVVVLGQFASSVIELIGLATIVPLLAMVSFGPNAKVHAGGLKMVINELFHTLMATIGLTVNIGTLMIVVVALLSIKSAISIGMMRHIGDVMASITTSVRVAMIRNLLNANWTYFSGQRLGRLVSGTRTEAAAVGDAFLCSATILSTFLQVLAYVAVALVISWKLSILVVFIGIFMFGTFGKLVQAGKEASKQHSKRLRRMASGFTDAVLGMKPIKAMGRQARFASLFESDARELHAAMRTKVVSSEFASELQEPVVAALLCVGLYLATTQWHLELHEQVVVGLLLIRITSSLSAIQRILHRLVSVQEMYRQAGCLLRESALAREVLTGTIEPTLSKCVEFQQVTFGYRPDRPILRKADWTLPAGRITALIGPSGEGKSTIVDLVMGLREPDEGEILIDGVSLRKIDLLAWRHLIGYVPQEVMLFNDTLFSNVTLGEPGFSEADVTEALRAAGAMSFVDTLAEGLQYKVGERGHRLSGGQRQRVAIARALVRQPALLVLDEATTGLDQKTEREICDAVRQIARDRPLTVLTISHHPIWVEIADLVFTISHKSIIPRDHTALMRAEASESTD